MRSKTRYRIVAEIKWFPFLFFKVEKKELGGYFSWLDNTVTIWGARRKIRKDKYPERYRKKIIWEG